MKRDVDFMVAVGKRLRKLREERGLTPEKVSIRKNISLYAIEEGRHNIPLGLLAALCEVYRITLYEFYKGMDRDESADAN